MAETDFIDRKIDGLGKFTNWIKESPLAFLCSVLTCLLFIFVWLYVTAKNENIALQQTSSKQIQDEIRAQLPDAVKPVVKQEVSDQTADMIEKVDTTNGQIQRMLKGVLK